MKTSTITELPWTTNTITVLEVQPKTITIQDHDDNTFKIRRPKTATWINNIKIGVELDVKIETYGDRNQYNKLTVLKTREGKIPITIMLDASFLDADLDDTELLGEYVLKELKRMRG